MGGEVSIDVGVVAGDPQATLEKMMLVQRAALAPADPSPQDRQVAALASQQANQARAEIASEGMGKSDSSPSASLTKDAQKIENDSANKSVGLGTGTGSEKISNRDEVQIFNDRIAKINEILVAISQNNTTQASGQLLNDVV